MAKSRAAQATAYMLPTLLAGGTFTRYSGQKYAASVLLQPDESTNLSLRLSQPLFSGGSKRSARRGAKLGVEKSRRSLESTKEAMLLSTSLQYYAALKAGRDLELKEAAVKRAKERKRVAQARFMAGKAVKSALLRAEAVEAGAEAELITTKSELINSKNRLKRMIGMTGSIELVEPELSPVIDRAVESLIKVALKQRLDYKESELTRRIAFEGVREVRGAYLPTVELIGLYNRYDNSPEITFFQDEALSASVVLSYPLFEGGLRRAKMREAKSAMYVAELEIIAATHDIELEVRESYNRMKSSAAVIEAYRRQLFFAREDYKMVFEQFKHGLATTVDVIDSGTELIDAERSLMNSTYDLQISILELKYAAGILLKEFSE